QVSGSMAATRPTVMAPTGQAWTQIPQPVHVRSSILNVMVVKSWGRLIVSNSRAARTDIVEMFSSAAVSGQALENLTAKTILSILQALSKHSPTTRKTDSLSPATRVLIRPGTTDSPDFESSSMKLPTASSIEPVFKG
ncbi:MAG: hypothetical protein M0P04_03695, partial [Syntrophales bacterium]|nr:hypothetical protein [Syntrophales bacterium]